MGEGRRGKERGGEERGDFLTLLPHLVDRVNCNALWDGCAHHAVVYEDQLSHRSRVAGLGKLFPQGRMGRREKKQKESQSVNSHPSIHK